MNVKIVIAVVLAAGLGAWFLLKDRQSSDPAEATRQATALAAKELPSLLEDATSKAQAATRQDLVDWKKVADDAIRTFQSRSGSSRKNPYEPGGPVFVAGPAGTRPGTVYLDSGKADSDGIVLLTGVYREAGTGSVRTEPQTVSLGSSWKPKPTGRQFEDHMIIQGL